MRVFICFFHFFFAKYNLFGLRNTPTKFHEVVPSRCKIVWKLVEKVNLAISGALSIGFFFSKYDLLRLQNMPTKFRLVVPSRCKVV